MWSGVLIRVCVGVPCATGPICSADGEGGGEGGKLAESSTAKGERERHTHTGKTTHRWEEGNERLITLLTLTVWVAS